MYLAIYDYSNTQKAILKSNEKYPIAGESYNEILTLDSNGQTELNFVLPLSVEIDGLMEDNYRWSYIIAEYKVKLIDNNDKIYWFKIKSTNDVHGNDGSLTSNVQCKSISYELNKKNTESIADLTGTATQLITYCLNNTGWTVGTIDTFSGKELSLKQSSPSNALNLLNEVATLFDGYLDFDTNLKKVNLYAKDNVNDTQILFTIGKNITSLERLTTSDEIMTRLYITGGEIDTGTVGIQTINPTKEPYIDNFTYYIQNGMITTAQQSLITQYNTDMTTLNGQISTAQGNFDTTNTTIGSKTVALNIAKYERDSKVARVAEIDTSLSIETNPTKKTALNNEKSTLNTEIATLNTQITTLTNEIASLNTTLASQETTVNNLYTTKQTKINQFYADLGDFIHEGAYSNTNLVVPQSVYDDGLKVLEDLCMPKVSYRLNIVDLSTITGYEMEKFKLHDVVDVIDSFLKIRTKVRITKIEKNLSDYTQTTIEIANFYTNIEELFKDITRNVEIIKNQQKYWDRTPKIVNADGTLDVSRLQASFDKGTYQLVNGTNDSIVTDENGITLTNLYDTNKKMRIDGDKIETSIDGGITWIPVVSSDGSNLQNVFGGVLDITEMYLRGDTNFFWNGDGFYAFNPLNVNHWIRFNHDGLIATLDNGVTTEFSLTWAGLSIGKSSVEGLETDLNNINQSIATSNDNLNNFINVTYANDLSGLQSQIDGNISTWFHSGVPTLSNTPADQWTTTEVKDNHLGDLYYDTTTGYAYRFKVDTGVYSWLRITDTDVTKALSDAAQAQDTADGKRRVFTTTPVPPYDIGDLWAGGASGDLKKCKTQKLTGQSYSSVDWELASKYTDDTVANQALTAADEALIAAENALQQGTAYNNVTITTARGVVATQNGGLTETILDGDGLKRRIISNGHVYNYINLFEAGIGVASGSYGRNAAASIADITDAYLDNLNVGILWVTLSNVDFVGRNFVVVPSYRGIDDFSFYTSTTGSALHEDIDVEILEYDYVNARFKIRARRWSYIYQSSAGGYFYASKGCKFSYIAFATS